MVIGSGVWSEMNETALILEHRAMAYAIASDFYIPGATYEDVRQEALIGLLQAVRQHNPELGPLKPFASKVIHRRLMDAVTAARRGKQRLLTESARTGMNDDHELVPVLDVLPDLDSDPVDVIGKADDFRRLRLAVRCLSPLERTSLGRLLNGVEYVGEKSIDNALQRARRKLRAAA